MGAVADRLEQLAGAVIAALALLDVFVTVLYARIQGGILSKHLGRATWSLFAVVAKRFSAREPGRVLAFCGPVVLVLLVAMWAFTLACGTAMMLQPALGHTILRADGGPTPTDFVSALYVAGGSMAVLGASDFVPQTGAMRMLDLCSSFVGISVLSLTLTYFMQVYSALHRRNSLALSVHLLSAGTGDAAELLARLGPRGRFDSGYGILAELAASVAAVAEAHHFYPVLYFFRFRESQYSISRLSLIALDAVTIAESALDDERHGWLKESAAMAELWGACLLMVTTLEDSFLEGGAATPDPPSAETSERWRRRYAAAVRRLNQAGIATTDAEDGAAVYAALRVQWEAHISKLAPSLGFTMREIDPSRGFSLERMVAVATACAHDPRSRGNVDVSVGSGLP